MKNLLGNSNIFLKIVVIFSIGIFLFKFAFHETIVYEIGKYKFLVQEKSGPLKVKQTLGWANNGPFLGGVGGVSFLAVAIPSESIANKKISLKYNPMAEDGHRLEIFIGEEKNSAEVPDWMLVPIAKYVNSDYNACVSLFGPRSNFQNFDIVFHPAFENTLLGLRLLQADVLLIDPKEFGYMPKIKDTLIIGKGENYYLAVSNERTIQKIDSVLMDELNYSHSWVIVDDGIDIMFHPNNNKIVISGIPYHYFWYNDKDQYLNNYKSTIWAKENRELIDELNPNVENALKLTMQFSAFFRYVKEKYPVEWQVFSEQVKGINIQPEVKTPTTWERLKDLGFDPRAINKKVEL